MTLHKSDGSEVTLSDIRAARSSAEWLRYSAGGLIAGGGSVAVAMILGVSNIQKQSYVALEVIYAVLLLTGTYLTWRMILPNPVKTGGLKAIMFFPGIWAISIAIISAKSAAHGFFPIVSYSSQWWLMVGLALGSTILGCQQRRSADRQIELLKSFQEVIAKKQPTEKTQPSIAEASQHTGSTGPVAYPTEEAEPVLDGRSGAAEDGD